MNFNRDENHKEKTRNLSHWEYLTQLQKEYVVAELRKKIYPSRTDREFYSRVMEHKKTKIEDISSRNNLPTVFSSQDEKERVYELVLNEKGYPNFLYKNDNIREQFEGQDFNNYYTTGAEVRVNIQDKVRVGSIVCVEGQNDDMIVVIEVLMKDTDQVESHLACNVTRIL